MENLSDSLEVGDDAYSVQERVDLKTLSIEMVRLKTTQENMMKEMDGLRMEVSRMNEIKMNLFKLEKEMTQKEELYQEIKECVLTLLEHWENLTSFFMDKIQVAAKLHKEESKTEMSMKTDSLMHLMEIKIQEINKNLVELLETRIKSRNQDLYQEFKKSEFNMRCELGRMHNIINNLSHSAAIQASGNIKHPGLNYWMPQHWRQQTHVPETKIKEVEVPQEDARKQELENIQQEGSSKQEGYVEQEIKESRDFSVKISKRNKSLSECCSLNVAAPIFIPNTANISANSSVNISANVSSAISANASTNSSVNTSAAFADISSDLSAADISATNTFDEIQKDNTYNADQRTLLSPLRLRWHYDDYNEDDEVEDDHEVEDSEEYESDREEVDDFPELSSSNLSSQLSNQTESKVQDTSAVNQPGIIHRYQLPNTPVFQFPNSHMPPGFHTPILPSFQAINMHGMHVPNMQGVSSEAHHLANLQMQGYPFFFNPLRHFQ